MFLSHEENYPFCDVTAPVPSTIVFTGTPLRFRSFVEEIELSNSSLIAKYMKSFINKLAQLKVEGR